MTTADIDTPAVKLVREAFSHAGVDLLDLSVREYPDETIFVVIVEEEDVGVAAVVGNSADETLAAAGFKAFVTVRRAEPAQARLRPSSTEGVHDDRATDLVRLIAARSRTSEVQPSLHYVRDVAANISAATAARHHLIFGRRGAGKTALMVEARRVVADDGHLTIWQNLQTLRHESVGRIYYTIVERVCDVIAVFYRDSRLTPRVSVLAAELQTRLARALVEDDVSEQDARRLVPEVQRLIQRFLESAGTRLYIFLDDFYFLARAEQPQLLDLLHGSVRDADAWLKVASIRHLTRWFQSDPPTGLQTGHDAALLDLDVTLQDPRRAKEFLETVLSNYARHAGVRRLSHLFAGGALDRLLLASGAVPRDYLTLGAGALARAQARSSARLVGTQDVNQAAGDAAQAKIQELEEDLAADHGSAASTLEALALLKVFCLEEKRSTYFRVDLRDKDSRPEQYGALTSLLEVRLAHLIDPSVSDQRRAGERAEVFMLDLSQFAGARLKQGIRVLDLERGLIVTKRTTEKNSTRVGRTPRQLVSIYRAAPLLDLAIFSGLSNGSRGDPAQISLLDS
jgi:hypothetical protein